VTGSTVHPSTKYESLGLTSVQTVQFRDQLSEALGVEEVPIEGLMFAEGTVEQVIRELGLGLSMSEEASSTTSRATTTTGTYTNTARTRSKSVGTPTSRTTTRSIAPVIMSLRGAKPHESDALVDTGVVVVSGAVAIFFLCLIAFLSWSFCRHREYGPFSAAISHREENMVSEPSDGAYMCHARTAQPTLTHSLSGFLRHVKSGVQGEYVGDEVDTSTVASDASGSLAIEAWRSGPPAVQARDAEVALASKASDAGDSPAIDAFVGHQVRDAEIALAIEAAEVGNELVLSFPLRPWSPARFKDDAGSPARFKDDAEGVFFV